MASLAPLKKKLMEVKLGELPRWLLLRDFSPGGIAGACRRGYDRYYKNNSISGITTVLAT
ncbi:ATP synthase subunit f, mitochondrial-like [Meriones unguiculatus]|uniref:ATP synthase subunit f, mitochondrial-like n=1 Tax=Meriones unguiculatus TaxID=10047 RepID=UPI00293F4935|nr:ATP synthase subunit f, mitochondrial-like [Meriones unguiculatus]